MCPIFSGCEDNSCLNLACTDQIFYVGMDEKRSLRRKCKHNRRIGRSHMNSAALIKQERQDDLRRATPTIAKRVEK